jgi:soluble lytic murein transglycosylase
LIRIAFLVFLHWSLLLGSAAPAFAALPGSKDQSGTDKSTSNSAFQSGLEFYLAGKFEQALPLFRQANDKNAAGVLAVYQKFFLADTLMQLGKADEADPLLKGILIEKPTSEIKFKTMFLLSQRSFDKGDWREARLRLQPLSKKWKTAPEYAQVLHRLMRVELKLHNRYQACSWAKKLYVRFPTHPLTASWNADLREVDVDGQKIGCQIKMSDFQDRVRRLELAGDGERARKEIDQVRAETPEKERPGIDLMTARFYINEGLVEDALALLIRNYPTQKTDFNYLNLLGIAAARAGEYQTAVGAYEKAHELSPRSKRGREALFQAGFLSYQFQDYDGAVRKFTQFVQENPRSGLSRDAQWNLAWLQYLRSDFEGSLKKMTEARNAGLRGRRFKGSTQEQRLLYWIAMANFRLNKMIDAKKGFEQVIQTAPGSYYALTATARLTQITKELPDTRATASAIVPEVVKPATEDDESEDTISKTEDAETEVAKDDDKETSDGEPLDSSEFKEPALKAHLEAARQLTALNLPDLARYELFEVERRTHNPTYLKLLITAYEAIGSFNRSASISELDFAGERMSGGIEAAKPLWASAFPQAYKKVVEKSASKQGIPSDWIWAIMRAESLYKPDVISPVGAKGLMQLMPNSARQLARLADQKDFKVEELGEPAVNIGLGSQYLARLSKEFKRSLPLVAAGYNAGPHRVEGWLVSFGHLDMDEFIEHIPFVETRNYAKKVILNSNAYRMIYAKDVQPLKWLAQPLGVAIPTKVPTHESWDAI